MFDYFDGFKKIKNFFHLLPEDENENKNEGSLSGAGSVVNFDENQIDLYNSIIPPNEEEEKDVDEKKIIDEHKKINDAFNNTIGKEEVISKPFEEEINSDVPEDEEIKKNFEIPKNENEGFLDYARDSVSESANNVVDFFGGFADYAKDSVSESTNNVVDFFGGFADYAKDSASESINNVTEGITNVTEGIADYVGGKVGYVKDKIENNKYYQATRSFIFNTVGGLYEGAKLNIKVNNIFNDVYTKTTKDLDADENKTLSIILSPHLGLRDQYIKFSQTIYEINNAKNLSNEEKKYLIDKELNSFLTDNANTKEIIKRKMEREGYDKNKSLDLIVNGALKFGENYQRYGVPEIERASKETEKNIKEIELEYSTEEELKEKKTQEVIATKYKTEFDKNVEDNYKTYLDKIKLDPLLTQDKKVQKINLAATKVKSLKNSGLRDDFTSSSIDALVSLDLLEEDLKTGKVGRDYIGRDIRDVIEYKIDVLKKHITEINTRKQKMISDFLTSDEKDWKVFAKSWLEDNGFANYEEAFSLKASFKEGTATTQSPDEYIRFLRGQYQNMNGGGLDKVLGVVGLISHAAFSDGVKGGVRILKEGLDYTFEDNYTYGKETLGITANTVFFKKEMESGGYAQYDKFFRGLYDASDEIAEQVATIILARKLTPATVEAGVAGAKGARGLVRGIKTVKGLEITAGVAEQAGIRAEAIKNRADRIKFMGKKGVIGMRDYIKKGAALNKDYAAKKFIDFSIDTLQNVSMSQLLSQYYDSPYVVGSLDFKLDMMFQTLTLAIEAGKLVNHIPKGTIEYEDAFASEFARLMAGEDTKHRNALNIKDKESMKDLARTYLEKINKDIETITKEDIGYGEVGELIMNEAKKKYDELEARTKKFYKNLKNAEENYINASTLNGEKEAAKKKYNQALKEFKKKIGRKEKKIVEDYEKMFYEGKKLLSTKGNPAWWKMVFKKYSKIFGDQYKQLVPVKNIVERIPTKAFEKYGTTVYVGSKVINEIHKEDLDVISNYKKIQIQKRLGPDATNEQVNKELKKELDELLSRNTKEDKGKFITEFIKKNGKEVMGDENYKIINGLLEGYDDKLMKEELYDIVMTKAELDYKKHIGEMDLDYQKKVDKLNNKIKSIEETKLKEIKEEFDKKIFNEGEDLLLKKTILADKVNPIENLGKTGTISIDGKKYFYHIKSDFNPAPFGYKSEHTIKYYFIDYDKYLKASEKGEVKFSRVAGKKGRKGDYVLHLNGKKENIHNVTFQDVNNDGNWKSSFTAIENLSNTIDEKFNPKTLDIVKHQDYIEGDTDFLSKVVDESASPKGVVYFKERHGYKFGEFDADKNVITMYDVKYQVTNGEVIDTIIHESMHAYLKQLTGEEKKLFEDFLKNKYREFNKKSKKNIDDLIKQGLYKGLNTEMQEKLADLAGSIYKSAADKTLLQKLLGRFIDYLKYIYDNFTYIFGFSRGSEIGILKKQEQEILGNFQKRLGLTPEEISTNAINKIGKIVSDKDIYNYYREGFIEIINKLKEKGVAVEFKDSGTILNKFKDGVTPTHRDVLIGSIVDKYYVDNSTKIKDEYIINNIDELYNVRGGGFVFTTEDRVSKIKDYMLQNGRQDLRIISINDKGIIKVHVESEKQSIFLDNIKKILNIYNEVSASESGFRTTLADYINMLTNKYRKRHFKKVEYLSLLGNTRPQEVLPDLKNECINKEYIEPLVFSSKSRKTTEVGLSFTNEEQAEVLKLQKEYGIEFNDTIGSKELYNESQKAASLEEYVNNILGKLIKSDKLSAKESLEILQQNKKIGFRFKDLERKIISSYYRNKNGKYLFSYSIENGVLKKEEYVGHISFFFKNLGIDNYSNDVFKLKNKVNDESRTGIIDKILHSRDVAEVRLDEIKGINENIKGDYIPTFVSESNDNLLFVKKSLLEENEIVKGILKKYNISMANATNKNRSLLMLGIGSGIFKTEGLSESFVKNFIFNPQDKEINEYIVKVSKYFGKLFSEDAKIKIPEDLYLLKLIDVGEYEDGTWFLINDKYNKYMTKMQGGIKYASNTAKVQINMNGMCIKGIVKSSHIDDIVSKIINSEENIEAFNNFLSNLGYNKVDLKDKSLTFQIKTLRPIINDLYNKGKLHGIALDTSLKIYAPGNKEVKVLNIKDVDLRDYGFGGKSVKKSKAQSLSWQAPSVFIRSKYYKKFKEIADKYNLIDVDGIIEGFNTLAKDTGKGLELLKNSLPSEYHLDIEDAIKNGYVSKMISNLRKDVLNQTLLKGYGTKGMGIDKITYSLLKKEFKHALQGDEEFVILKRNELTKDFKSGDKIFLYRNPINTPKSLQFVRIIFTDDINNIKTKEVREFLENIYSKDDDIIHLTSGIAKSMLGDFDGDDYYLLTKISKDKEFQKLMEDLTNDYVYKNVKYPKGEKKLQKIDSMISVVSSRKGGKRSVGGSTLWQRGLVGNFAIGIDYEDKELLKIYNAGAKAIQDAVDGKQPSIPKILRDLYSEEIKGEGFSYYNIITNKENLSDDISSYVDEILKSDLKTLEVKYGISEKDGMLLKALLKVEPYLQSIERGGIDAIKYKQILTLREMLGKSRTHNTYSTSASALSYLGIMERKIKNGYSYISHVFDKSITTIDGEAKIKEFIKTLNEKIKKYNETFTIDTGVIGGIKKDLNKVKIFGEELTKDTKLKGDNVFRLINNGKQIEIKMNGFGKELQKKIYGYLLITNHYSVNKLSKEVLNLIPNEIRKDFVNSIKKIEGEYNLGGLAKLGEVMNNRLGFKQGTSLGEKIYKIDPLTLGFKGKKEIDNIERYYKKLYVPKLTPPKHAGMRGYIDNTNSLIVGTIFNDEKRFNSIQAGTIDFKTNSIVDSDEYANFLNDVVNDVNTKLYKSEEETKILEHYNDGNILNDLEKKAFENKTENINKLKKEIDDGINDSCFI